jgi:hypothetical protein
MKQTCLFCGKVVDEKYRVNEYGDVFYNDDCYNHFYETHECKDILHPYIDDYESIRSNYLDWLENWEHDINVDPERNNLQYHADDILDKIDEVYEAYRDFLYTEGDDGVFAREIYSYLRKFQDLQQKILLWRPEREIFFYLSLELSVNENIADWEAFAKYLYQIEAIEIYELLKDHVHPYDTLAFYFETQEELDMVIEKLEQIFHDDIDIYYDKASRCEGECADIEVIDNVGYQNGWFFCDSCEQSYYPRFFAKEELQKEIQLIDELIELQKPLKKSNWHFYIRKMKRSCRYHEIDYPEWIDLDYHF